MSASSQMLDTPVTGAPRSAVRPFVIVVTAWVLRSTRASAGALGAFLLLRGSRQRPHAEVTAAAPPAKPMQVEVLELVPATVPARPRFLGQTEASLVVEIRSRVKGFIVERAFEEGQKVEQSQVLVRIDPRTNRVVQHFTGAGGGVILVAHGALWLAATPTAIWRLDPKLVEATRD